jgi:ParB-like chromosome segregation protein Spo0J
MKEMFPAVSAVQKFATKNITRALIQNAPYNPRTITIEGRKKLKASLEEFGSVMPPVWNERTGNLVGGHQRIEQIDAIEGNTDYALTVAVVDLPEEREKALNVILNSPEVGGQFDDVLLKRVLLDVEGSLNFDLNDFIAKAEKSARKRVADATPRKVRSIDATYEVVVECKDEDHQRRVFELVSSQGEKCRLLTL